MSDSHSEGIQSTPGHETSHAIQAGHGHEAHAPADSPFSDAEVAHFRKEDVFAGGAVVVLMTSIFSIGVVLYTVVLIAVSQNP